MNEVHKGKVIQTVDPLNRRRVKVKTDSLGETIPWAEPLTPLDVPTIGDHVYVFFLDGNKNKPVWVGGFEHTYANDPHGDDQHSRDYDADFVNMSGDEMEGSLDFVNADGTNNFVKLGGLYTGMSLLLSYLTFYSSVSDGWKFRGWDGSTWNDRFIIPQSGESIVYEDLRVKGALNVEGSKNALIVDPADSTKAYRFGAMEADEPGLLFHRMSITIPQGEQEASVGLPEHWESNR